MGKVKVEYKLLPEEQLKKYKEKLLKGISETIGDIKEVGSVVLPLPPPPEDKELKTEDDKQQAKIYREYYSKIEGLDISEVLVSYMEKIKEYLEQSKTLEETDKIYDQFRETLKDLILTQEGEITTKEQDPTATGERIRTFLRFERQTPSLRDPLEDLEQIRKSAKSGLVKVAKDFWKSQIWSPGDALDFIKDEKTKKRIRKKAEEGKYIAGTLVGLSGGERYFKIFCLALAQTLNEQSKFYNTQEDLSGVPQALISQYAGEGAIVEKIKEPTQIFKGGERPYPIIFLSWEDLAKKMSATGEISGGKDIKVIRDYVLGGVVKKKDKKTGVEKETFVPGLLGREYLVEGANSIVGVPLMSKIFSLYPKDSPDKEVGIAVQLSTLFAIKNVFGYTGIRSDTIQLLGGGKQRELTINLFLFLAYYRGVPPQTGRNKGEFVQRKEDLLKDISSGIAYYTGRPGLLEKHFIDAVQKCIEAKILLPGETKTGLKGYREEVNPGGERLSIFTYNPDYLKGEEVNLFTEIEEQ